MGFTIGIAGNPNVGKSTIFNALTGMNQHTGNWTGKTVTNAVGKCSYKNTEFLLVDIPGTYSLISNSEEEEIAKNYICSGKADVIVVIVDATCLERNLNLAFQTLAITNNVILCVNLLDEAKNKGISVDLELLSQKLGIPVVGTCARKTKTLKKLLDVIYNVCTKKITPNPIKIPVSEDIEQYIKDIYIKAEEICTRTCRYKKDDYNERNRKIDKILTSKVFGIPIMIAFLGLIFWITISLANYPTEILSNLFGKLQDQLYKIFEYINAPKWTEGLFIDGMYQTLTWVISVMLPPMAIFFPLFTFLEDLGYLPRIAFNLDRFFKKCSASGKQALTMCMGFGCNACRSEWL